MKEEEFARQCNIRLVFEIHRISAEILVELNRKGLSMPENRADMPYGSALFMQINVGLGLELLLKTLLEDTIITHKLEHIYKKLDDKWKKIIDAAYADSGILPCEPHYPVTGAEVKLIPRQNTAQEFFKFCDKRNILFNSRYTYLELQKNPKAYITIPRRAIKLLGNLLDNEEIMKYCSMILGPNFSYFKVKAF